MSVRKNSRCLQSLWMAVLGIVSVSSIFIGSALGQDFKRPDGSVPLPLDWSDRHVIYTVESTPEQVEKMQGDPRYFAAMRLHAKELADENAANGYPFLRRTSRWEPPELRTPLSESPELRKPRWVRPELRRNTEFGLKKDWSVSLGPTAGVAAGQSPAKFSFDVNAAPSCTNDYVVFPINAPTGYTRASVTGAFIGTASNGGTVTLSVTLGGSAIAVTLTPSLVLNTGLFFQVSTSTTTEASNLAAAINRNLTTPNANAVMAVASTNTVTVYTLTPGSGVTLTASASVSNFAFS